MDFLNEVKKISNQFSARLNHIDSEEATKNSLVLPFIQLLGYDIFDPTEVIPEFKVDVGTKGGERVDYALFNSGMPTLLVECHSYGSSNSGAHLSQLISCLKATNIRFGMITDGISYSIYSDLDDQDAKESMPFLEIHLLDYSESQVNELRLFTKSEFDKEESVVEAYRRKFLSDIRIRIARELTDPTDDFIRLIMRPEISGSSTKLDVNHFRPLIREAFDEIVDDCRVSHSNPAPYFAEYAIKPAPAVKPTELINWTSISQVSHVTHRDPPTAIKFEESESQQIDYWREVLREVTDWLVRTGRLSRNDLPIGGNGDGFPFVNSVPSSPNGADYIYPRRVSGDIFIETNYNANNLIMYSKKLLAHHSIDLEKIRLRFG